MKKRGEKSFSIRLKVMVAVIGSVVVITVGIFVVSSKVLLNSYLEIEKSETLLNVGRASDALQNMIDQLDVQLADWASWDDTHQFILDRNSAYLESNLGVNSLVNLKIDGMIFLDRQGDPVFVKMVDYQTKEELSAGSVLAHLKAHPELRTHDTTASPASGIILLPEGPALVASEPILTSEGEGPINGSLIFIKFLSADEIKSLGALTHLEVSTFPYAGDAVPADVGSAKLELSEDNPLVVQALTNNLVAGYGILYDLYGEHILILRIETDRPIYHQGKKTFASYALMMGAIAPIFSLLMLILLQNLIFSRLGRLNREIEKIKGVGGSAKVTEGADDEFLVLERAINNMLTKITDSQLDLEKFKLAVANAAEHVIITDPDAKVLYANASAEKITGYKLTEMVGKTPSLWGGEMPAPFYKKMWKVISKDKQTFTGEIRNKRKTGESYLASVSISPILDSQGQVQFFVGLEQDITKQREDEEAMKRYAIELQKAKDSVDIEVKGKTRELGEERARFLASVNSLQIGFSIIDQDGLLLISNPALLVILATKQKLKTLDDVSRLLGKEVNLFARLSECTDKKCVVNIGEIEFGKKYLHVSITPVFVDGGRQAVGGVMLLEDITDAKLIEKTKSEFVSLASHQLRTPLSTINWYLEMLLSGDAGKITKNQQAYLTEIEVGNKRMVALVNSLLNVSRLEMGRLTVEAKPTNLSALVKESVKTADKKIEQQKLKVTEDCDDLGNISLDAKYARMIVDNVLINAIKYTPEGGTVEVSLKKLEKGDKFGGRVTSEACAGLAISDTGYGIPEAQQKKVFEKLFRADNVLDKDEEGTGLGLFIVKTILDQSGGQIWFESKENVGTTFYITLPLTGMKSRSGTATLS